MELEFTPEQQAEQVRATSRTLTPPNMLALAQNTISVALAYARQGIDSRPLMRAANELAIETIDCYYSGPEAERLREAHLNMAEMIDRIKA